MAESYIGCFITLISNYDIRYEGILHFLNLHDSTIALKNVRSYGTEGRRKDGPQLPPIDKTYDFILFRGNDIKVKSPPTSLKAEEQVLDDPAIIQQQYSGVISSPVPSVCSGSLTESVQTHDTPAITSRAVPAELSSRRSVAQLGPSSSPLNQSAATQVASPRSFSTSVTWQGNNEASTTSSYSRQQSSPIRPPSKSPLTMQHWMQTPETQAPTKVGWTPLSDYGAPSSSISASLLVNPTSPSPTSVQISDSLNSSALWSTKPPMPYSVSMASNGSNMSSFSSPFRDINSVDGQMFAKISPNPVLSHPGHFIRHPASSFVGFTSGPLLTPPSLLTPDHLAQPRPHFLSLAHNFNPDRKDMNCSTLTSFSSSVLVPSSASQAPPLPLPNSVVFQKPFCPPLEFLEEFDFEAMNEKFKKDEVWGSLGRATEKVEDYDHYCLIPNPKPAYNKDDFFDSISGNSLTRGLRNGQNRFTERMKQDTETFGNFQQRPNFSYGGNRGGRGENFRGAYGSGRRGYGYGGRRYGPNLHF
ncbi:hypothetical protein TanjilG_28187 [Lupinus angustifolius]|uniref:DFDF domain-containing protein n=1 Tax=Lupinus angustifolius TaxID=3871 RepID=A0A4P1RF29_LUPAN|nr:hypothetical protein TanjilG_28187 [Lupinus angustifolius]